MFIKEKTNNVLLWKMNYIINVTHVNIETYSEDDEEPDWANITIVNEGVTLLASKTLFNILSDTSLRLKEVISSGGLTEKEISVIEETDIGFMVDRSSFMLKRLRVVANFDNPNIEVEVIRSLSNDGKQLTLIDTFFQIQGKILLNRHTGTNIYIQNFEADFYATSEGVTYIISCNFPEAILNHTVVIKNIVVYNSRPRVRTIITSFKIAGDPNITVTNATWLLYGSSIEDTAPLEMHITSA